MHHCSVNGYNMVISEREIGIVITSKAFVYIGTMKNVSIFFPSVCPRSSDPFYKVNKMDHYFWLELLIQFLEDI